MYSKYSQGDEIKLEQVNHNFCFKFLHIIILSVNAYNKKYFIDKFKSLSLAEFY